MIFLCIAATFNVDADASSLRYAITHKLHKVAAESKAVKGAAQLSADGALKVMVRAPIASFKSGDANRDEHMLEAVEASKYPSVTVKAVTKLTLPATYPATLKAELDSEVDVHGVVQRERVPVTIELLSSDRARVTGAFTISLDKYKVERPALLFVKIEDACAIDLDLLATQS